MVHHYLWFFYALGAAVLWGLQYATIEQLLRTVPSSLLTLAYGMSIGLTYLIAMVWLRADLGLDQFRTYLTVKNLLFFGLIVLTGCISTLLIVSAIDKGTATKASLLEITYPFFVALFATLLYREQPISWQTLIGGILMLTGGAVILRG